VLHIESDRLIIDDLMRHRTETPSGEPVPDNYPSLGTWGPNRTPWRVYLFEPTDSLLPIVWVLEVAGRRYPLAQSSTWSEEYGTDFSLSWRETAAWRVRDATGRWVTGLQSLPVEDDITID